MKIGDLSEWIKAHIVTHERWEKIRDSENMCLCFDTEEDFIEYFFKKQTE